MIIYDYSKDSSLYSILFSLITIVCVCCLIILIILGIKTVMKNGVSYHIILVSLAVIVMLILSGFVSYRTYTIIDYNLKCTSGNYETVSGTFEIVSITQDDYRDEELYTIDFIVNGVSFNDPVNSFSAKQKNMLSTIDKNVEIRYSYINDELVIYQIVICIDE